MCVVDNRYGKFKINSRCTGLCCTFFCVGKNKEQLLNSVSEEMRFVGSIIEELTYDEYIRDAPKTKRYSQYPDLIASKEEYESRTNKMLRCTKFDSENKVCTIYDKRPSMCHSYPFSNKNHECEFIECTCSFEKIQDGFSTPTPKQTWTPPSATMPGTKVEG